MSFTPINVRKPSFQRLFRWAFIVRSGSNNESRNKCKSQKRKRSDLKNGLDNLLKVIFRVSNHKEVGRARSNKQSNNKCNSRSKSICCNRSRGAMVATLSESPASKLVFAIVRILVRTAMSRGSSHQAGWVGSSKRS